MEKRHGSIKIKPKDEKQEANGLRDKYSQYAVLFVDDQLETRSAYQLYFKRYLKFLTAKNYAEANEILKRENNFEIGVILADLKLSKTEEEFSGLTLLKECRVKYPSIARILITGHADSGICVKIVNSGAAQRMIGKPCLLEDLKKTLYGAMDIFIENKKGQLS